MIKNSQTLTINSLLKGTPLNVLLGYKTNTQKTSFINDIVDISFLLKRQIIYVDTFSIFLRLREKPENLIVISPFDMSLQQFFSTLLCCPIGSIIVIDSYPTIINAFFGEEEKADRLFLYLLAKIKHSFHIIVLVYVNPEKDIPSFPIFDKRFYDKFLLN
jgi:hypothetical protein